MTFLLQKTIQEEIEISIVKDTIKQSLPYKAGTIDYEMVSIEDITNPKYKTGIPVGNIEFIEKWLSYFYNKPMTPIEVPLILRTEEFLKRKYTICNPSSIPQKGRYFLKNAEKLNEIGLKLEGEYGVNYLYSDFKKQNGYKRSTEISNEYEMYRQYYCGCVYSKKQRDDEIAAKEREREE